VFVFVCLYMGLVVCVCVCEFVQVCAGVYYIFTDDAQPCEAEENQSVKKPHPPPARNW